MIDAILSGKIYGQPRQAIGKNGNPYALAKMKVSTGMDGELVFASVIAFGDSSVQALAHLADGDACCVAGSVKLGTYQAKDGQTRVSVDVTASSVLSAYHVKAKRAKVQGDGSDTAPARPPAGRTGHGSAPRQGNAPSGRAFEQWQASQLSADDFADMEGDVL